ncbi:MAG: SdpI family protein [Phycisphaerales bacterium]|nr:SdpI family protein [Phycisphaerales bacterium]
MELMLGVLLAAAGVFVALGIPLMLGKVRPNGLYGFRTEATLKDPAVWYPVNRTGGAWFVVGGVAIAISAVATYFAGLSVQTIAMVNLGVVFASTLCAVVAGLRVQRRLTAARG